jgi:hypothetical protein
MKKALKKLDKSIGEKAIINGLTISSVEEPEA